ncbi:MAG: monofunctional biosynthetic peptidoglycan transglycosylase [Chitinophagales bacterium]|nr:monofunctional biosynthetic peptidoglycan transglycosylase [Chitinophagales bacterium]
MIKKLLRFLFKVILWFFGLSVFSVIVFRFVPVPVTILMLQRCIEQKADSKPLTLKKDWVSLDKISNKLQLAVVTSEDQNFLWHSGFDMEAIEKAIEYNEKQKQRKRKKMRGASTISQQTAKNVFLFPSRNFLRKGLEVYFTVLIEILWSKQRIMEVYLNVIEMGNGIYGAEAAAQHYFHKPAAKLNASEAALIAAALPNPRKFNAGKPSAYLLKRQAFILGQMMQWGGKLDYEMKPFKD